MKKLIFLIGITFAFTSCSNMESDAKKVCDLTTKSMDMMSEVIQLTMKAGFGDEETKKEAQSKLDELQADLEKNGKEIASIRGKYDENEIKAYLDENCEATKKMNEFKVNLENSPLPTSESLNEDRVYETITKLDNRYNEFHTKDLQEIIVKEKNILRILINKKEQILLEEELISIEDLKYKVIEFIDNGGGYDKCEYCNGTRDPRSSDNPTKSIISLKMDMLENDRYLYFKALIEEAYSYLRNQLSLKKYNQSLDSMIYDYYYPDWQGDRSFLKQRIYLIRSLYPINLILENQGDEEALILAPPPPPPLEVIEVIEDEEEIEETVIKSTETNQDEEIGIEDLVIEEAEEDVEVPFFLVENVPILPGCETAKDKRKCMSENIAKFVNRKFNADLAGDLGLSGKLRITTIFKIDKNGNVVGVRARAPHPRLEKEATRVINLLPDMKPGKQRGEAVIVSYSLPIIFQVQD